MVGTSNPANNIFINQPVTFVASGSYAVLSTDVLINVNFGGSVSITLPSPTAGNLGKFYIIKDASGAASSNNITISPASGQIDGASNTVINTNYGMRQIVSNGLTWLLQAPLPSSSPGLVTGSYVATSNVNAPSSTTTANAVTFMFVTLPSSGTWEITYILHVVASGSAVCAALFSGGNTTIGAATGGSLIANSELMGISTSVNVITSGTGVAFLTTVSAINLVCGIYSPGTGGTAASDGNGRSKMLFRQIG